MSSATPEAGATLVRAVSTGEASSADSVVHAILKNDLQHVEHLVELTGHRVSREAYDTAHKLGNRDIIAFIDAHFDPYTEETEDGAFGREELEALERAEHEAGLDRDDDTDVDEFGVSRAAVDQEAEEFQRDVADDAALMAAADAIEAEEAYEQARREGVVPSDDAEEAKEQGHAAAQQAADDLQDSLARELALSLAVDNDDAEAVRALVAQGTRVSRTAYDLAHRKDNAELKAIIDAHFQPYDELAADEAGAFSRQELNELAAADELVEEMEADARALADEDA